MPLLHTTSGSTALVVLFAVLGGVFVVLFPFFEAVLGWSPIRSMLGLLPMLVVMISASGMASNMSKRVHARATMLGGVGAGAVGLGLTAALGSVAGGYLCIFLLLRAPRHATSPLHAPDLGGTA